MLDKCQIVAKHHRHRFRFKNKIYSLDASVIDLCLSMFDWVAYRQTKGAVKLHLLLDHDGYLPTFALITEGKVPDVKITRTFDLPPDSIVAMDRGYNDYSLFGRWTSKGVYFVTRLKSNAKCNVIEKRKLPKIRNILADEIIEFSRFDAFLSCPCRLRRIVVWDAEQNRKFVFLTNHLKFGATTIAQIYKDRWQIETFFKILKQNLKVKTFVGTSSNALKTQIWTALIAILILKFLQLSSKWSWSMSNLVALLRWNLFTYRDLWLWIDDPFDTPPQTPHSMQLEFGL